MKDNKDALFFFILLVIVVGMAWNPAKPGTPRQSASSPAVAKTSIEQDAPPEQKVQDLNREVEQLNRKVQAENTKLKRSPYYGKISASLSGTNSEDPNNELITIFTNLDSGEKVNITGWKFKSTVTGNQAVIGRAALLPYPNQGTETDVVLTQNDIVYLGKGYSPIGLSFRTNKCTGYFEENRTFSPPLPLVCPRPTDDGVPIFSSNLDEQDACLDAVKYIPTCATRGTSYTRNLPDTVPATCKTYIQNEINYDTCVKKHYSDINFHGHEYRLYLKSFAHLWRDYDRHDNINLYDSAGLIVATISY